MSEPGQSPEIQPSVEVRAAAEEFLPREVIDALDDELLERALELAQVDSDYIEYHGNAMRERAPEAIEQDMQRAIEMHDLI